MGNESVVRIVLQQLLYPPLHFLCVKACTFLTDILFNAGGGYVKSIVMPSDSGITKKGKGGRIRKGFICCQIKTSMCGRNEGRYGPTFFTKAHRSAVHIDPYTATARKLIELSSFRQLDPFFLRDGKSIPAASAGYIKGCIFKNFSLTIRI